MDKQNKAGFSAYIAAPVMTIILYVLASVLFFIIFKDISTVIFFVILAMIFTTFMSLYAIVPDKVKNKIRLINVFLITLLLFVLGCILGRQNFQIEGLFFYLLTGTFGGVIIHFVMGKIIGPIFIGRSWCSWGCWTIALFDLLPYKESRGWKKGNLKYLKYIHLILSLTIVAVLVFGFKYFIHDPNQSPDKPGTLRALYWFVIGNGFYYLFGIILALILKDNRAFCKYLCPVSLSLKLANLFSFLRIKGKKDKCDKCNICVDKCLFNIDIPKYISENTRVKSSECVMCMKCIASCPNGVLSSSIGFDIVTKDHTKNIKVF